MYSIQVSKRYENRGFNAMKLHFSQLVLAEFLIVYLFTFDTRIYNTLQCYIGICIP